MSLQSIQCIISFSIFRFSIISTATSNLCIFQEYYTSTMTLFQENDHAKLTLFPEALIHFVAVKRSRREKYFFSNVLLHFQSLLTLSITATELKRNLGKYPLLAAAEDIYITRNGRVVAKLSNLSGQGRYCQVHGRYSPG